MIVRERLVLIMGIGNIGNMMKIMNAWNTFKQNHPKFPAFCSAVSRRGIREGSILEVTYISPEGEKLTTNIKVQASDLELLRELCGGNCVEQIATGDYTLYMSA